MNCHGSNKDNNQEISQRKGKHMFIMILCCLIPFLLLFALPFLEISNKSLYNYWGIGIFLLCPVLHGMIMFIMMKSSKKDKE